VPIARAKKRSRDPLTRFLTRSSLLRLEIRSASAVFVDGREIAQLGASPGEKEGSVCMTRMMGRPAALGDTAGPVILVAVATELWESEAKLPLISLRVKASRAAETIQTLLGESSRDSK
jgi:hypothetical protein